MAAVSQLLGHAIIIIQKVQEAGARVLGASDRVDRYRGQLDNLLATLHLVRNERELQIPAVEEQIQAVMNIGEELRVKLDVLAAWSAKSKTKQYMHVLASGDRDEKDLDKIRVEHSCIIKGLILNPLHFIDKLWGSNVLKWNINDTVGYDIIVSVGNERIRTPSPCWLDNCPSS